ncbi:toxin-antitoxin system YwqK family antitoxin [Flavobacterium soyangense]|uniref:Membrane-binding protein n=1 Tax=Flavobacterium soyangense TaxID=2023265 RepID=A0A930XVF9_9FLAO|nr:hypothetical protein [Flavobacterium soyangense]MBF2709605.1 hypothetical protein [Flavobacterium soyangense]
MHKLIYLLILLSCIRVSGQKVYFKEYFGNGKIKSEGWLIEGQKVDYWLYYYENGDKKEEGHFANNKKSKWWIFYNIKDEVSKKCEFANDKMHGLCLIYKDGAIIRAEKYQMGKKIKQWNSIKEFKKDNPIYLL